MDTYLAILARFLKIPPLPAAFPSTHLAAGEKTQMRSPGEVSHPILPLSHFLTAFMDTVQMWSENYDHKFKISSYKYSIPCCCAFM